MINSSKLAVELQQFHGTENWFKHPLSNVKYTDGVKYLADNAESYWLLDLIVSYNLLHRYLKEPFQVYELKVKEDKSATIIISDGNHHILDTQELEFTDFPLSEITLWCVDRVILLPSEY